NSRGVTSQSGAVGRMSASRFTRSALRMHPDNPRAFVSKSVDRSPGAEEATMFGKRPNMGSFVVVVACLALAMDISGTTLGQQGAAPRKTQTNRKTQAKRAQARKSVARSPLRPKGGTEEKSVADRIVLRDGKELLGQVDDSSTNAALTILARRELV